ncbi:MAG: hypothetical protein ACYC7E_04710 [Armatimonadota bacterium]
MKPIQATERQKPLDTLQACLDAVNTQGAVGTLRWADGFAIPLGTVVYLAMMPIVGTQQLAVVYAVQGFEEGGEHHSCFHVHRIVNWSAEDPPLLFAVIDDEGRSLEFALLVPSCDDDRIAELAAWRAQVEANPARRDERYGFVRTALTFMAQEWAEQAAQE